MHYWNHLITNPFFWCFFAAAPVGIALSWATIRTGRRKNPTKSKRIKWTSAPLLIAIAVLVLLTGTFISDPAEFITPLFGASFGAFTLFFAVFFRLKWIGLVLGIILIAALALGIAVFYPIPSAYPQTTIAEIKVLTMEEDYSFAEISLPYAIPLFQEFNGSKIRLDLEIYTFHELFFFLGGRKFFWINRIEGYSGERAGGNAVAARPEGVSVRFLEWLFSSLSLPGLSGTKRSIEIELELLSGKRLFFNRDMEIQTEEL
jgi:hypothetical protein